MHITLVAGARPNFIKLAPLVWAAKKAKADGLDIGYTLVYTGTEDDPDIEPHLFADLAIGRPDVCLGVDCESINELTGRVMSAFDDYAMSHPTDVVVVCDDLASTMAVAIVTKKRGLLLAHLVAGTRSFDITMPKEINRLVIDGLSDLLFTAGVNANSIASREGAEYNKVYMVGNLLIDTLRHNYPKFVRPSCINDIDGDNYLVMTLNRKALIADDDFLGSMVRTVEEHCGETTVVAPLREYARERIASLLSPASPIRIVDSLPYREFGYLTSHARGIITDSGNVAEEATFLTIPCLTLNDYTEHIETVTIGSNTLVGSDTALLASSLRSILDSTYKHSSVPDRWDGRTAERIIKVFMN